MTSRQFTLLSAGQFNILHKQGNVVTTVRLQVIRGILYAMELGADQPKIVYDAAMIEKARIGNNTSDNHIVFFDDTSELHCFEIKAYNLHDLDSDSDEHACSPS